MLRQLLLILCVTMLSASAAYAGQMARVLFVTGDVLVERDQHILRPVVGDMIDEGDTLTTNDGAHVHLQTVDHGFISLRPASQLYIASYQYDPQTPKDTHIKLDLRYGVMRALSGTGAQAAKQNYRLNTPVAAIGIRGTDYSVIASDDYTRATVRSGGITMTNYSASCSQSGVGACSGQGSSELFANQGDALLQVLRNQNMSQRIDNPPAQQKPDVIQPPRPEENSNLVAQKHSMNTVAGVTGVPVLEGAHVTDIESRLRTIPTLPTSTASDTVGRQLYWGKWQKVANMPADEVASQLNQLKMVALNPLFVLAQDKGSFTMPADGKVSFNLTGSEAYIVPPQANAVPLPATVSNAVLTVDFTQHSFDTSLTTTANQAGKTISLPFHAVGSVSSDGKMNASYFDVNGAIVGSLAGSNATSAAYLYQTRVNVPTDYQAVGAAAWQRP